MTSSAGPDSQAGESLFDFLYLDRVRLASFAAQLFDDGQLTQLKRSSAIGSNLSGDLSAGVPGLAKGSLKSGESTTENIERHFDASWSAPLNILRELQARGYISKMSTEWKLGQLVILNGYIQILDLRILQKLWRPVIALESATSPQQKNKALQQIENRLKSKLVDTVEVLPHFIQMGAFNNDHQLWGVLIPEALTINRI